MDDVGTLPLHQQITGLGREQARSTLTQMADNYMPFKWMSIKP